MCALPRIVCMCNCVMKTQKNEEDYEFEIEDDEELDEAALAARYRPGGDPSADLLSSM